ncbi:DUF883 family protein [Stappia sp.]|uniref:DUF883 family protein n=1 Tax=Stappia sp. TaxID=1870903 RepID=UPI003A99EEC5
MATSKSNPSGASASTADTAPSTEDLARQVATIRADIAALTKTLTEFGKAQGDYLATEARKGADDMRRAGEEQFQLLRTQANDAGRQAEEFVAKNPGTALGIAAGAGFLIGLISSRR